MFKPELFGLGNNTVFHSLPIQLKKNLKGPEDLKDQTQGATSKNGIRLKSSTDQ